MGFKHVSAEQKSSHGLWWSKQIFPEFLSGEGWWEVMEVKFKVSINFATLKSTGREEIFWVVLTDRQNGHINAFEPFAHSSKQGKQYEWRQGRDRGSFMVPKHSWHFTISCQIIDISVPGDGHTSIFLKNKCSQRRSGAICDNLSVICSMWN